MDGDAVLAEVNAPGLSAVRRYLGEGTAIAFLGPGASAPLYRSGRALALALIDAAIDQGLPAADAEALRSLAGSGSDSVVELLRGGLDVPRFRSVLRSVLAVQRDPVTGRSWTAVQELVCRMPFAGAVTTAFDSGIVDARMRVRPAATGTGFTSWSDSLGLDRWRTGDVFGDDELPVLYAHGYHSRPDELVLATTEYRRAYEGALPSVLRALFRARHVVWIGFDFGDARIAAVMREVTAAAGTRDEPGMAPRHVAFLPWDGESDLRMLARLSVLENGAHPALHEPAADEVDDRLRPAVQLRPGGGHHRLTQPPVGRLGQQPFDQGPATRIQRLRQLRPDERHGPARRQVPLQRPQPGSVHRLQSRVPVHTNHLGTTVSPSAAFSGEGLSG